MNNRRPADGSVRDERPPQRQRTNTYTSRRGEQDNFNLGAPVGGWEGHEEGTQVCEL
jgi:hypothetical protein